MHGEAVFRLPVESYHPLERENALSSSMNVVMQSRVVSSSLWHAASIRLPYAAPQNTHDAEMTSSWVTSRFSWYPRKRFAVRLQRSSSSSYLFKNYQKRYKPVKLATNNTAKKKKKNLFITNKHIHQTSD